MTTFETRQTAAGNSYEAVVYEDPFPGRLGKERVRENCGYCSGTGVYAGKSGWTFYTPSVGTVEKGCFYCHGRGYHEPLISSLRASVRRANKIYNEHAAEQADWNAPAAVAEREEQARKEQEEADRKEAERLGVMVQGFAGEVGDRLRKIEVTVELNYEMEGSDFITGRPIAQSLLIFRTTEGNVLKWTTGYRNVQKGDKLTISGTVKAHANYNGQDQTVLTRGIIH